MNNLPNFIKKTFCASRIENICNSFSEVHVFSHFPWVSFICKEVDWGYNVSVLSKSSWLALGEDLDYDGGIPLSKASMTHCLSLRRSFLKVTTLKVTFFSFNFSQNLGLVDSLKLSIISLDTLNYEQHF